MQTATVESPAPVTPIEPSVIVHVRRGRLHAALKAVAPHAYRGTTRFHMMSVAFELTDRKLRLVTTNGHCLAMAMIDVDGFSDHKLVMISLDDVKSAVKLLAGSRKLMDRKVQLRISKSTITIEVDATVATVATYKTIDAVYPPYRQVMPDRATGATVIQHCSPEYLMMMGASVEAFRTSASTGARIQLGTKELDPIRIDYDHESDGQFVGIIMPMRQ